VSIVLGSAKALVERAMPPKAALKINFFLMAIS
jgi:hypothetical protein